MSSGPVGVDFREYSYSTHYTAIPTAAPDIYRISAANAWKVTRIRIWMTPTVGGFIALNQAIPIAAGGCVCLEPNGAHREDIFVQGLGAVVIVEYWFQSRPDGTRPPITVTL